MLEAWAQHSLAIVKSSICLGALLAIATSCTDAAHSVVGTKDQVSALVVPCEPTPYEPCIGSSAAPGGTTFDRVSARFYFPPDGYVNAFGNNSHAVSTILGTTPFAPIGVPSPSGALWNGVCWTNNPDCKPRDGTTAEKGVYSSLSSSLEASQDFDCQMIGQMMTSRIFDEATTGRRAFFMFDRKILGVNPEGVRGTLSGSAHVNPNDPQNGEIGVYSWGGRNSREVETTMIHETSHFLGFDDASTSTSTNAYLVAAKCMAAIGH